jgi:hypothetical protein
MALNESRLRRIINDEMTRVLRESPENEDLMMKIIKAAQRAISGDFRNYHGEKPEPIDNVRQDVAAVMSKINDEYNRVGFDIEKYMEWFGGELWDRGVRIEYNIDQHNDDGAGNIRPLTNLEATIVDKSKYDPSEEEEEEEEEEELSEVKRGKGNLSETLRMYNRLVEGLSPRFRALVESDGSDDVENVSCKVVGLEKQDEQDDEFILTLETSGMLGDRPFRMREKTKISYDVKEREEGGSYVDVFAGGESYDHEFLEGDDSMMGDIMYSPTYQEEYGRCLDSAVEKIKNDSDILDSFHDSESERRDPYGYRGLSRSDF